AMLALGARAGGIGDLVAEGALTGRSTRLLESRMAHAVNERVVLRRQAADATVATPSSTSNMTQWDADVNTACQAALAKLTTATNPSGTCTCYNLPVLNTETGAFMADLRLYQISTANQDFVGIPPDQVMVALSYNGASVSPVNMTTAQSVVTAKRATTPQLLQTYMFVGQIDQAKVAAGMNLSVIEEYVTPIVTLSAKNTSGQIVSTNVSSNEASFLTGALSTDVVLSSTTLAQIAVDQVVAGLANGTVAFVLPGVNLLIFPIGLVITGTWFVIGLAVIGFGFFERVQYREAYRQSSALATK
ncbi:hypothetical protein BD289DRAFT_354943, partial [Coniella lustricola]